MPTTPASPPSRASLALALALPLLVLAGAGAWLGRKEPGTLSANAARMEADLARLEPDVIALGNSVSGCALDADRMNALLAPHGATFLSLHANASRPPVWYAVLKHRVYANGHKPRVVMILGLADQMITTSNEGVDWRLEEQLVDEDPTILEKTYGASPGGAPLRRLENRRDTLRMDLFAWLRNASAGLVVEGDGTIVERGAREAEQALTRVFSAEGALDLTQKRRMLPVAEAQEDEKEAPAADPRESYLPEISDLARENGARVVWVHVPVPTTSFRARPNPERDRAIVETLNDHGAAWVDLRDLRLPDSSFADLVHLKASGRASVTEVLVKKIVDLGVFGDAPLAPNLLPLVASRAERLGTPPPLPSLASPERVPDTACGWSMKLQGSRIPGEDTLRAAGLGLLSPLRLLEDGTPLQAHVPRTKHQETCTGAFLHNRDKVFFSPRDDGDSDPATDRTWSVDLDPSLPLRAGPGLDAWWVWPGTAIRFSLDEPWEPARGAFSVTAVVQAFGTGGAPTVQATGSAPIPLAGAGAYLRGVAEGPAPTGPWTLEIASPSDGPYVLVRSVAVGTGAGSSWLVGNATTEGGARAVLLGVTNKPAGSVTWKAPPPPLPGGDTLLGGREPHFGFEGLDFLMEKALGKRVGSQKDCDPIRLTRDGQPSPLARKPCGQVRTGKEPGWCHGVDGVYLRMPDGSDPTAGQPTPSTPTSGWHVSLAPERTCDKLAWHYPGDHLVATLQQAPFPVGADRLEVFGSLASDGDPDTPLHVVVRLGDRVLLEADGPVGRLAEGLTWDLPGRIPRGTKGVQVEISTGPDAPWLLLATVALSEARPFDLLPAVTDLP